MAPRETENNDYAKFWGDKQEHYGMLWYFCQLTIPFANNETNHLGLDDLAPNSTCLTKISRKPKEKPFFFFHSLDGKNMASVFADGGFVFVN